MGAGRPRGDVVKRPVIFADITEAERELVKRAAKRSGFNSFNAWARARLVRDARQELNLPPED